VNFIQFRLFFTRLGRLTPARNWLGFDSVNGFTLFGLSKWISLCFKSLLMNDQSGTTAQSSPQWSYLRLEKPNSKTKRPRNIIRSNFGMADVYWLIVPRRKWTFSMPIPHGSDHRHSQNSFQFAAPPACKKFSPHFWNCVSDREFFEICTCGRALWKLRKICPYHRILPRQKHNTLIVQGLKYHMFTWVTPNEVRTHRISYPTVRYCRLEEIRLCNFRTIPRKTKNQFHIILTLQ
jgi:hypothetical protein